MRKLIARWLIDSAIDDNRTQNLPNWVAKLIIRDGKLASDIHEQQQLIDGLKNDATPWIAAHSETPDATAASPTPTEITPMRLRSTPGGGSRSLRWISVATVACVLVGAVSVFNMTTTPKPPEPTTVTAFKVDEVRDALDRSEQTLLKLTDKVQQLASAAPVQRTSAKALGKLTTQYVEEAGSLFGRGLAVLNRGGR